MSTAEVSVVIPTRDRWELLQSRGLRAALLQEGVRVEVVVVDDGSPAVPERVIGLDDPRVRLVRHARHRGVAASRNTGISEASAPWIAFLDDDDAWAPSKLLSVLGAARLADAGFGYSDILVTDDYLRPLGRVSAPPPNGLATDLLRENVVPAGASNVVVSGSLLDRCGGFDESLSAVCDWDMWLRLAACARGVRTDKLLVAYRRATWVLRDEAAHRADIERFRNKHRALAARRGTSVDWLAHERFVAYTTYQSGRRRAAARRYLGAGLRHRDPGSLARAAGTILTPELADRLRRRPPPASPSWLGLYRQSRPG